MSDQVADKNFENGLWSKPTKYVVFGAKSIFSKISKKFQNWTSLGCDQIIEYLKNPFFGKNMVFYLAQYFVYLLPDLLTEAVLGEYKSDFDEWAVVWKLF